MPWQRKQTSWCPGLRDFLDCSTRRGTICPVRPYGKNPSRTVGVTERTRADGRTDRVKPIYAYCADGMALSQALSHHVFLPKCFSTNVFFPNLACENGKISILLEEYKLRSLPIITTIHPHPFLDKGAVRVPFYGFGSTRLCQTPALHASLSCGSTPARLRLSTSVFLTHSDHVFLGLPFFQVLGITKFVINLIQDVYQWTHTVGTPYNTNVGVQKIPDRAIWKPVVAKRNNTNS